MWFLQTPHLILYGHALSDICMEIPFRQTQDETRRFLSGEVSVEMSCIGLV